MLNHYMKLRCVGACFVPQVFGVQAAAEVEIVYDEVLEASKNVFRSPTYIVKDEEHQATYSGEGNEVDEIFNDVLLQPETN